MLSYITDISSIALVRKEKIKFSCCQQIVIKRTVNIRINTCVTVCVHVHLAWCGCCCTCACIFMLVVVLI